MLSLHQVVDSLYTQARPVLTWYGSDRVELGGPVLARWFSKTANLLTNEYSDLFASHSEDDQHIIIDLPACWQKIVWISAATLCGWDVSVKARQATPLDQVSYSEGVVTGEADLETSDALPPATIYVTDHFSPRAERAQQQGADLLLQNLAMYSLQWEDDLPTGGIDALEALMSHNDILENDYEAMDWPESAPRTRSQESALNGSHVCSDAPQQHRLVIHEADALALYEPLTELWAAGGSAIIVDPSLYDSEEAASIMLVELPHGGGSEPAAYGERNSTIGRLTRQSPAGPASAHFNAP